MFRRLLVAAAVLAGVTGALAQSDPIAERQQLMKDMSQAAKAPGAIMKGEAPFDLAKVQASLATFANVAKKAPTLFPDNSKTGHDTEALPKIWTDKADFNAKWEKFGKDAASAQASITDEATFKANFPGVAKNCGACHETYRAKKS
jgi:cytochrome c556